MYRIDGTSLGFPWKPAQDTRTRTSKILTDPWRLALCSLPDADEWLIQMVGRLKFEGPESTSHSNSLVYCDDGWVISVTQNCVMMLDPRYRIRSTTSVEEYSYSDKTPNLNARAITHRRSADPIVVIPQQQDTTFNVGDINTC